MIKSTRTLLIGSALSGLLAGTATSVAAHEAGRAKQPTVKKAMRAGEDEKKASKTKLEKHACKGQNSCKGKGGCGETKGKNDCKGKGSCRTDGKPMDKS